MKKVVISAVLGASLFTTGCASIVSDSSYPVSIHSAPEGASFEITNKNGVKIHTGRTPTTVTLKSGAGFFSSATYNLTFKKDGFEDKTVVLESSMDGWYIGNLVFGGLLGFLIVDPITGAMWKLPEAQSVSLDGKLAAADSAELTIVSIDRIPEDQRQGLIRIN